MKTAMFLTLLAVIFYFAFFQANFQNYEVTYNETNPQILSNLLIFHNIERSRFDAQKLELDYELILYAQNHAEWMAKKNSLTHSDISKIKNFKINGENIAWNYADEEQVLTAWMNSTGHRKNILNQKFNKVGFGLARNSKNQIYWCAVFGG